MHNELFAFLSRFIISSGSNIALLQSINEVGSRVLL